MKELSIFIDESGDFGEVVNTSPYLTQFSAEIDKFRFTISNSVFCQILLTIKLHL